MRLTNDNPSGVYGTDIRVLEGRHKIGFYGLLQGTYGRRLEPGTISSVLSNLANEPLKGKFADQHFRGLLIKADLSERRFFAELSACFLPEKL